VSGSIVTYWSKEFGPTDYMSERRGRAIENYSRLLYWGMAGTLAVL
jgi:hypothetical protein